MGRPLLVTRFYECGLPKRIVGGTVADETGGKRRGKRGSIPRFRTSTAPFPVAEDTCTAESNTREICSRIFVVPSSFLLAIIPLFLVSSVLFYFFRWIFPLVRFETVWDKSNKRANLKKMEIKRTVVF